MQSIFEWADLLVGAGVALVSAIAAFAYARRQPSIDSLPADILDEMEHRSDQIQVLLKDEERLQSVLRRSVALEAALYAHVREASDSVASATSPSGININQKDWEKAKKGLGYVGDKLLDKLMGLLNGMVGLPGPKKRS